MDIEAKHSRRQMLKIGVTAIAAVPMIGLSTRANATQNAAIRAALKFQGKPNGDKQCAKCVNFIPLASKPTNNEAINGCKLYPGDTEIPPFGYCNGFVAKVVAK